MLEMKIDRTFFMVKLLDFSGKPMVACMTGGKLLGSFRACLMELSETRCTHCTVQWLLFTLGKHMFFDLLCQEFAR